jgi:hypothetical protein
MYPHGWPNSPSNDRAEKKHIARGQKTTPQASRSSPLWARLEAFVREQVQRFIRALLEEIAAQLGRPKSARTGLPKEY